METGKRWEIGPLYGFRAVMTLLIANFHIWQQSWLHQGVVVFGKNVSLDYITRSSYVFVDGLLLLSGFLLYLPWVQRRQEGREPPRALPFYRNRLLRILPSYLFAVLTAYFLFALPQGRFSGDAARRLDLWSHLTLTQTFFQAPYLFTELNGALWTICIEMQFYLLFPLLARWTQKRPALTLGCMTAAGWLYRLAVAAYAQDTAMLVNQLPAFLDVYALGMLGAALYGYLRERASRLSDKRLFSLGATLAFVLCVCGVLALLRAQSAVGVMGAEPLRRGQLRRRFPLALLLLGCILSSAFLPRPLEWLLSNRLMRWLAAVSYNFYIWHQFLAVQYVRFWFPDTLHTDRGLQWAFTVLCYSSALLLAAALTRVADAAARLARGPGFLRFSSRKD